MSFLSSIKLYFSGKNEDLIWKSFSAKNNGKYIVGKFDNADCVEIDFLGHKIFFDRYIHYQSIGARPSETEFTRVRLEFSSSDTFRFKITNQGFIDSIGKLFGAQDIKIGDREFDKKMMIKGNDEFKVKTIFSNSIINELILSQKDIQLQILENEGIFNESISDGNLMLYYISQTHVKNIEQLADLLKLYSELILQLKKMMVID